MVNKWVMDCDAFYRTLEGAPHKALLRKGFDG
jgi:hypothetical protein